MTATAALPGVAVLVAALGAWTDARTRRIPNWLTLPTIGLGVLSQLVLGGKAGLLWSLEGVAVALVLLFPGYLARLMGAGDIKLLAAVGALVGFRLALVATLLSLVAGGGIALVIAVRRRAVRVALRGVARLGLWIVVRATGPYASAPAPSMSGLRAPFGLAILAGTVLAVWTGIGA